jgi:hypothetical protein
MLILVGLILGDDLVIYDYFGAVIDYDCDDR